MSPAQHQMSNKIIDTDGIIQLVNRVENVVVKDLYQKLVETKTNLKTPEEIFDLFTL